jgi:hypothetical protein
MQRSLVIGLIVFAVSLLLQVSAIGEIKQVFDNNNNYYKKSYSDSKHPLKDLIIKKAAFDAACNTIVLTLANLPECEDCPAAKKAANKLKQATKRLEKINDYLSYDTPNPLDLGLKEKAAISIIYRSMRDDAYMISITLDRWRLRIEELLKDPWFLGAIVASAIAVPLAIDNQEEICNSVLNEDDCNDVGGCYWYTDQQGNGHCVDEESYLP